VPNRNQIGDRVAKVQAMKTEFGGSNPTPLERLLVDRIVVCWLPLQQVSQQG
jgi:hypothetical protein